MGDRTKKIVGMVAQQVRALAPDKDVAALAQKALENAGLKIVSEEKGADVLFFMSRSQARALAELIIAGNSDKKAYKAALKEMPSVDMVLFGRMVASDPSLNYDAAAQVAHSISTHAVQNEYDYFTAVDDCAPEDNAGAGHLGTTEYNSATLYRYATVNVAELAAHMSGEECGRVLRAFAEAFIRSMPTGKQNSFATVSYTHLDVYKRQEQYRVLPVDRCRSDGWQGTLSGAGETGAGRIAAHCSLGERVPAHE